MSSEYEVRAGDCISSIAGIFGFLPDTIWNHPDNAELKRLRENPNVLFPGDRVTIPDKGKVAVEVATDTRHRFKRKAVPAKTRIQLLLNREPQANKPYEVQIDSVWGEDGSTDENGFAEISIPPQANKLTVTLTGGTTRESYVFNLGSLDPIATDTGVEQRLNLLGYPVRGGIESAVNRFQQDHQLAVGGISSETRQKLLDLFGI